MRISKAFAEFESTPIAAASLGQVHRARLRDGRPVAVKVQRPGIREQMLEDLEAFREIAAFLDQHSELGGRYELEKTVEEFRKTILGELDYRQEAVEPRGDRPADARVPAHRRPGAGRRLHDVARADDGLRPAARRSRALSPLAPARARRARLSPRSSSARTSQQILIDGFFHADPHPGNVFMTEDGRIALLDLGMVARISPALQENLLKLLLDVSEGQRRPGGASGPRRSGARLEGFDALELERKVSELVGATSTRRSRRCRSGACCSTSRAPRATRGCACRPS